MKPIFLVAALVLLGAVSRGQDVLWTASTAASSVSSGLFVGATLVAVPDATGDGVPDYVVSTFTGVWDLHSGADGSRVRTLGSASPGPTLASLAILDDHDGDGVPELAMTLGATISIVSPVSGATLTSIPLPQFVGTFPALTPFPILAAVPDQDGDGRRDLAVGIAQVGSGIAPLLVPPGGVIIPPPPATPSPTAVDIRSSATGALLVSIPALTADAAPTRRVGPAGDFDGDGIAEFAIAEISPTLARIDIRSAGGALVTSFTPSGQWASAPSTRFDVSQDVTGDGVPDLVVGVPYALGNAGVVEIYSGATGALAASVTGVFGTRLGVRLSLGDLDGDGIAEIAAADAPVGGAPPTVHLIRVPTGQIFSSMADHLPRADAATFADLDGDGLTDLIATGVDAAGTMIGHVALRGATGTGPAGTGSPLGEGLLRVNDRIGDWGRRVTVPRASPLGFDLLAPAGSVGPFPFAVFGFLGEASPNDAFDLGGTIGPMAFIPSVAYPAGVPVLFTLATSLNGVPGTIVLAPPGPWSLALPAGIDASLSLSLQGLFVAPDGGIERTNALILRII
ncbi:MAG: FG-GAP repeat protein [Planctomycetota bacterium]